MSARVGKSLRALLFTATLGSWLFAGTLSGQTLPNPPTTATTDPNATDRASGPQDSVSGSLPSQVSLSASQIISILQRDLKWWWS